MLEHFSIYKENLSFYYVICCVLSVIAICASWWFSVKTEKSYEKNSDVDDSSECEESDNENAQNVENATTSTDYVNYKLRDKLEVNMSNEDLQREKQIEREQLANILELLQKDYEKFQIDSFQDLEEQMKLYKNM